MAYHSGSCAKCKSERNLIRITEFGKTICKECFPEFVAGRVENLMRKRQMYRKRDRVGVALSGGKDSSALLHILNDLRHRLNIRPVGMHVNMGIGEFSDESEQTVRELCDQVNVELITDRVADYGIHIEPVGQFKQCNVCGSVRRALLNRMSMKHDIQTLATGHTLDDVLQFMLKAILSGTLRAPTPLLPHTAHRPRKIKPLYFIPEEATGKYAELVQIPFTEAQCPEFVPESHRFKQVFDLLEELAPMGKVQYAHTVLREMPKPDISDLERKCKMCGEPTNTYYCPICRLRRAQAEENK